MREKLSDVLPHGVIFSMFAGIITVYFRERNNAVLLIIPGFLFHVEHLRAGLRFKIVPRGTFPTALCSTWNNCLRLISVVPPNSPLFPHFAFSY